MRVGDVTGNTPLDGNSKSRGGKSRSPDNGKGDTLEISVDPGGHTVLSWQTPAVDGGHDPATLYRIDRATSADGPFTETDSITSG